MLISQAGGGPTLRGAVDEPELQQIRFDDIHDGVWLFADRCGNRLQPDRPPVELMDDCLQNPSIGVVQAELIHLEQRQGVRGDGAGDPTIGTHLGEVPDAAKEA